MNKIFILSIMILLSSISEKGEALNRTEIPNSYESKFLDDVKPDKKLKISAVKLSPEGLFQRDQGADKTIDGNSKTGYHSPWRGIDFDTDITFEYALETEGGEINTLDYILLTPRPWGQNGIIKEGEIYVKSTSKTDYILVSSFSFDDSNAAKRVDLEIPVQNPTGIKLVVKDAYSGDDKYFVSLREFEAFENSAKESFAKDEKYFTDKSFSELVSGFKKKDLQKIANRFVRNLAENILEGTYSDRGFRVQEYSPYRTLGSLSKELKTNRYNAFENPTGVYFKQGEKVVIFVGDKDDYQLSLRVTDFSETPPIDNNYTLQEGVNVLIMKGSGNGYISYYTDDYKTAPKVKINIASGDINGYYDMDKHDASRAQQLLDSAVSPIFDLIAKNVQLSYSTESLRTYTGKDLSGLVSTYDTIIGIQKHMLGLAKYNRATTNRMFGRVIWKGFMHADGIGAAFHNTTMKNLASLERLTQKGDGLWGVAHEFGHVNQVRPELTWVGTVECTNNIYSVYTQYLYTPQNLRLEHENIKGEIGGRFNAYLNNAFINKQEWGLQAGPDAKYEVNKNGRWGGDHFVKVCPLWQLQLYFHIAGEGNVWGKPWFWQEVFEAARRHSGNTDNHGQLQLDFVSYVCDAVQMNLSDFFTEIGMLKPVDKYFDDYTAAQKTITQEMIDKTVSKISKYPKPKHLIKYISGNSITAYKGQLPVEGIYNEGISTADDKMIISHDVWKNAVVFETYKDDELIKITLAGTGTKNNSSTSLEYPKTATRLEAVAFDGKRTLVFGKR